MNPTTEFTQACHEFVYQVDLIGVVQGIDPFDEELFEYVADALIDAAEALNALAADEGLTGLVAVTKPSGLLVSVDLDTLTTSSIRLLEIAARPIRLVDGDDDE